MANEKEVHVEREPIAETRKLRKLEDDEEYDYITVPPDGGFGWVVLIACFMINLIVDGFLYAFGAFSEELQKVFRCPEWQLSFVISLACGFYLLSAPVASALCNRWGCRPIGIIGSFIASASIAASIFSPNIYVMWLLFGFIGGIGMGLVYLPSIIMVGYYFGEKRAIATGIVTAGTGIGSVTFAPLSSFLFIYFKWKMALLILAGILLLCAVCCALMVPLKPIRKKRILEQSKEADDNALTATTTSPLIYETKSTEPVVASSSIRKSRDSVHDATALEMLPKNSRTNSVSSVRSRRSIKAEDAVRPLYKEDVLYQGDTKALPEYQSQPDLPTYVQETTKVPDTVVPSKMKTFWDVFLSMTNFDVLKDKKMLVICLANVCSMIGYYTPYLFIVKTAEFERKISHDSAVYLLSVIGFSNTIARFASGWVAAIPGMSPLLVNNIGLTVAGIATLLVPLCDSHALLILYCIIWGGFIAFHVSLSPVIVCKIVGLERYSTAFGVTLMFRGITSLSAPPLMGAIRDKTNSFNISFIIGGLSFLVSALMHFYLMWLERRKDVEPKKNKSVTSPSALDV